MSFFLMYSVLVTAVLCNFHPGDQTVEAIGLQLYIQRFQRGLEGKNKKP